METAGSSELELPLNLNSFEMSGPGYDNNRINRLRHLAFIYSFLSVYLLLLQFSMPQRNKAPGSPTKKATAKWNNQETESLIKFLHIEADRIGGPGTSFKEASYTAAAAHIRDLHSEGPIKTAAHCRTKWTSVSSTSIVL
jgi:hypothetical protein